MPIVQGGTFSFLVPTIAILTLEENLCPKDFPKNGWAELSDVQKADEAEEWQRRMREIQGAIIICNYSEVPNKRGNAGSVCYNGQTIAKSEASRPFIRYSE